MAYIAFTKQLLPVQYSYSMTLIYVGEFGKVYKGTWQRKADNGVTVSEVVAVKTIKSTQL